MYRVIMTSIIIIAFLNLNFLFLINTEIIPMCDTLDEDNSLLKSQRIRPLCDILQSAQRISDKEDLNLIPDFDLNQIETENEANQILKRFRRSRFSSSSGSRSSSSSSSGSSSSLSGGSSRISSGSSASSSSSGSGSRIFSRSGTSSGSGSSSSSSGSGSRIFSRSGTSSGSGSSSSSSGSGSRIFSRSGTSGGSGSSSSGSGSRIFSRSGTSSGSGSTSSPSGSSRLFSRSGTSSGSGSSSSGSGSRIFSRSGTSSGSGSTASPSGSGSRFFSRSITSSSSVTSTSSGHRIRENIRSIIRKPTSSGSGISPGSNGLSGTSGTKPSISDKIRKITHSRTGSGSQFGTGGSGGLSGTGGSKPSISDKIRKITHSIGGSGNQFGTGGSGGSGNQFGTGGSGGSGSNVWVRTGKKFLPYAVRFGKRYYQRRKYNKGMYAGMGAGAGYYAGRQTNHREDDYPYENYGYPPVVDNTPEEIDGEIPMVFYCIQEDLNTTLVNNTLDHEGFGICNISGELVTCPIEIECQKSEADNCCEDEQGTPYCCGGPIPDEYVSQYGGYEDDESDGTRILNIITAIWIMMSTICFTIWQRRE